ncbi:MAG: B12-binding domain-containing radical SAM protein [Candidatus Omnitrophica bacterium]|nr:B12-binding domain-containing radical SAM protein [Candidatus Omnitrophota bacterium]
MRVIFVTDLFSIIEPMGAMQLSAILKAHGHETDICALQEGKTIDMIKTYGPQVIACSFMTTEAERFRLFVEKARQLFPYTVIIAGGPHPTYYPQIVDTWALDAVVVGEGDMIIVPLLEGLIQRKSVRMLMNVHTKEFKNPQGDLVADLDSLPFADRELVAHKEPFNYIPMKTFFATRGCPYSCSYCFNSAFNLMHKGKGDILRRRSVENLVTELGRVKAQYRPDFMRFGDDTFVIKYDAWVEEFVEKYRSRIGVPFYCLINPNLVEEKLIKALKTAGCYSVMMGIESGDETIRRRVLERPVSDQSIKKAFKIFHELDIRVFSNTILALPETTLQDDLESLEFTLDCRPAYSGFTVFTPFAGTSLGDYVSQKGYMNLSDTMLKTIPVSMQAGSVLNTVTDRERQIHRNILILAPIANLFPWMRRLITRHWIYQKPNILFDLMGFCVRNYCNWRVFPFGISVVGFFSLLKKVFYIDKANYQDIG